MRVKLPLFLGGFYPFLGCPALFLRPSTVGVKTNRAGREGGGDLTLVTASTEHQPNIDSFKQYPATKYKNVF